MRSWSRILAVATGVVAAGCGLGAARFEAAPGAGAGVLPLYTLGSAQVFVEVQFAAREGEAAKPVLLLLDTGARNTALDLDVAERLGLRVEETGAESTGALGTQPVRRTRVSRLVLPGVVTLRNWPISVLQITLGIDGGGALPVAGVLGTDLLDRFDVLLDVPAGAVTLGPPGSVAPPEGALAVPFDWSRREVLVRMEASGDSYTMEIDSGAEAVLLFRRGAGLPEGRAAELIVGGAGDTDSLRTSAVKTLTLSDVRVGDLRVAYVDAILWEDPRRAKDGLLGMEVLARHALHVDFRAGVARFGPARALPESIAAGAASAARTTPRSPRMGTAGPTDYRRVLERRLLARLAGDADDYEATLALGMLRLVEGANDDARRLLGWAATLRPDDPEAHYRRALAEWGAGARDAALDAASRAAKMGRGRPLYDRLVRALVAELAHGVARPPPVHAEVLELDAEIHVR